MKPVQEKKEENVKVFQFRRLNMETTETEVEEFEVTTENKVEEFEVAYEDEKIIE